MIKKIIYSFLLILTSIGAYMLGFYLFKPNEVVLDDVSLKEVVKEEKKTMAIMLGDKNGVYTESDSNFWPSNKKYIFNSERSGCIDMKGNPVDGILSYNNELMAATIVSGKTVSCYLYFDLETVAPQEFIFYLGGITNPDYTNTREIPTYITYQDDDISHYCLTKDNTSNTCVWNEVTDIENKIITPNYTLDDSDTLQTVYAYLRDEAGNISPVVTDTITLDRTPSTGTITINDGAIYTNNANVTLTMTSTDAVSMCISNEVNCTNYVTYSSSASHTLTDGDETKTVYVYYKDVAGNISSAVTDTIILDTTAPSAPTTMSFVFSDWSPYTDSELTNKAVYAGKAQGNEGPEGATDENGIMKYQISSDNSTWVDYSYDTSNSMYKMTTTGTHKRYFRAVDNAGNAGPSIVRTAVIDVTAPTGGSVSINNNATYSTSRTVTLTLSATGASQMCISESSSCSNYVTYATSKSYTFSSDGTKTIYVTYKDAAGNTSTRVNDSIIVDTANPTVTVTNNGSTLTISSNEAGTYCINTSSTRTNMSSCTFSGSISANSAKTTSEFTTEGTYYVHVKDSAGNIGISSAQEIVLAKTLGEYLLENALSGKTAYAGLYRYTGTNSNTKNYVSVGGVKYRIIGVTDGSTINTNLGLSANQVKVMKATSIGTKKWHTDHNTADVCWNVSGYTVADLYTTLQGSTVLGKSTVIPSEWVDKISSVKWYVGDVSGDDASYVGNASTVFGYEDNATTQSAAKVGLMYLSDYIYAYNDGGTTNCHSSACKSWMTISNDYEWTMTHYGRNGTAYYYSAWTVASTSYVGNWGFSYPYAVRPVFYLDSSVLYTGEGDGSSGSPYQIS